MPSWLHETPIHLLVRDRTLPLPSLPRLPGLQLRHFWASSPGPAVPSCPPRQRLVFLKTHKSGSSSVLSLLHRYGDRHGLRFALPARYQFGYPRLFQASRVKGYRPQSGGTQPPFHILCHHMRFSLCTTLCLCPIPLLIRTSVIGSGPTSMHCDLVFTDIRGINT